MAEMVKQTGHKVVAAPSRADRPTSFNLADIPMPGGREEDWRFTPLERIKVLLADTLEGEAPRVEVGGQDLNENNRINLGPSSYVEIATDSDIHGKIGAPGDRAAVVEWNNHRDLVNVVIAEQLREPVRIKVIGESRQPAAQHICIDVKPDAKALVILEHTGDAQLNQGVEIDVESGAQLEFVSIQEWDRAAVHASNHRMSVEKDAKLKHIAITLGGDLVRICPDIELDKPGGEVELFGVYFTDTDQHQEHRLFVNHSAENCRSDVHYKGALQGQQAHAVWIGDVLIGKKAFNTDSYEQNRNLVLNQGAKADSVPNLEIKNGEIAGAGHASATGRFDEEQLFYLLSRGIPEDIARKMVVHGFFAEVIRQIGIEEIEERLLHAVDARLEKGPDPL
ncbi:Fe-S cluster assembly protein SufD [uncultured Varibaculum sp.]|uniref:Fe-S cluster assembly protein SufD n=1 Tax=uncultured Varibaculum sp. TaxID=413896 RepID=UPI002889D0FC|nr:Fe-S cluster assembly protein SufD [uncultured Varibaculum sp.]